MQIYFFQNSRDRSMPHNTNIHTHTHTRLSVYMFVAFAFFGLPYKDVMEMCLMNTNHQSFVVVAHAQINEKNPHKKSTNTVTNSQSVTVGRKTAKKERPLFTPVICVLKWLS